MCTAISLRHQSARARIGRVFHADALASNGEQTADNEQILADVQQ